MDLKKQIDDISKAISVFSDLAPGQTAFVEFTRQALENEVSRGARKTYLKRLQNEMTVYAKNVLSKEKYESFKSNVSETSVRPVPENVLQRIIDQRRVTSQAEFRLAVEHIDTLLSKENELSEDAQSMIVVTQKYLSEYEQRIKKII